MSMDDWGWGEATEAKLPQATEVLPPGTYAAEIRSAKWQRKDRVPEKWMDRNPEGWRINLCLRVDLNGVEHIFYADIPRHWRWLFEDICGALDLPLPDSPDWEPSAWVGRKVEVDTDIWQSNAGPKVDAKKFRKAPAAPAQPAARRPNTGAAKVAAARGDAPGNGDDIPF